MAPRLRRNRKARWWRVLCCFSSITKEEEAPEAAPASPPETENMTYEVEGNSSPRDLLDSEGTLHNISSICDKDSTRTPTSDIASERRKNVTYDVEETSSPWVYQDQQDTLDDVSSIKDEEWFPSPNSARIFSLGASEPRKNVTYDVEENLDSRDQQNTLDDVSSIKDEEWFPSPNSASVLQTQRNQTFTVEVLLCLVLLGRTGDPG
ncbi:uncharacterized protein LOC144588849 isoform X2 [Pogona vitticeps]